MTRTPEPPGQTPMPGPAAVTTAAATAEFRYRAFISYSHRDERWARWLHRSLESYRPPKRLVGQTTPMGTIPPRLAPVFRDREELASATDLGNVITEALMASACQIVICSPAAATSRWVNEEILEFKRLGREDRIFCLIVGGEPNATAIAGREAEECFPEALRFRLGRDGMLSTGRAEPIAADVREGKDGKFHGLLKLIAGLLGVGFDALRQREHQRRQRRLAVIATAAVIGMAVTSTLATFALLARAEADRQRQRAEAEAETARQTADFLTGLFAVSDPGEARGNTVTAREILDQGARRIRGSLDQQPAVKARLMDTIGTVYRSLGLYPEAGALLQEALDLRIDALGPENPDVALSRAHVAEILSLQARYQEADPLYRHALEAQRRHLGERAPAIADTLAAYAGLRTAEGRFGEAELLLRESLQIRRQTLGRKHLLVAHSLENLGMSLFDQGDYRAAENMLREATSIRRSILGDSPHPELADGLNNEGLVLMEMGELPGAERMYKQALEMNRRLLDPLHPTIAVNLNNLAMVLHDQGKLAEAAPLYREVLSIREKALGQDHPEVARALNNLAFLLYDQGRHAEAIAMGRKSLAIYQRLFRGDHPDVATELANVGGWLAISGKLAEAEPMLEQALAMRRRLYDGDHAETALSEVALAHLYLKSGRFAEARQLAADGRDMLARTLTPDHWRTAWAASVEAAARWRLGDRAGAEPVLRASLTKLRSGPGSGGRALYVKLTQEFLRQ